MRRRVWVAAVIGGLVGLSGCLDVIETAEGTTVTGEDEFQIPGDEGDVIEIRLVNEADEVATVRIDAPDGTTLLEEDVQSEKTIEIDVEEDGDHTIYVEAEHARVHFWVHGE